MSDRCDVRRCRPHSETRLQKTLDARGITSASVERRLAMRMGTRAPSRTQVARWRYERGDIRRKDMIRLLWAVREEAGDPELNITELFDLDPDNPGNWVD